MVVTGASQAAAGGASADSRGAAARPWSPSARRVSAPLLRCDFVLQADLTRLALPVRRTGERRDELWRHTCFEAFVSAAEGSGYYEFNFSPPGTGRRISSRTTAAA